MQDRIHEDSLLIADLPPGAYQDSFVITLPPGQHALDAVILAFFRAAPAWFHRLLALRNGLVKIFGLKTGPATITVMPPFAVGQQ